MTDKSPESEDRMLTDDEREANRRFQETLGRLVNTPHKPHKANTPSGPAGGRKGSVPEKG